MTDSGGAGRFRGGPASETVFGPAGNGMTAYYFADGAAQPPAGVAGGHPGMGASAAILRADGSRDPIPPLGGSDLAPGEFILGVECGGGGYGNPLERDPASVLSDVLEGWVSREAAESVYGVVLQGESDEALAVDVAATAARRSAPHRSGV